MNKLFLTLSATAILVVSASSANAQYPGGYPAPGPMPPMYGEAMYGGPMYGGYGGGHIGMHGALPHPGGGLFSGLFTNHGPHKHDKRKGPIQRLFNDDPQDGSRQFPPRIGPGGGVGIVSDGGLMGYNQNNDRYRNAQVLPVATGGTLVFPQNPFVRSPRDFFMYDR
jgi:hypothetical protein